MTLELLMNLFAALPHSDVGRGPKHPTNPDADLEPVLLEYFRSFPYLPRYTEYADFLERYAGASIGPDKSRHFMVLLIFGLDNFDMPDADPLVDGFHVFCTFRRRAEDGQFIEHGFAFNTNDNNDFSVYRHVKWDAPFQFYHESFLTWLNEVVQQGGMMA